MSNNKKFSLILLGLVILPVLIFIFKDNFIDFGSARNNQLNNILLFLAILGCGTIFYLDHKQHNTGGIWRTLSIVLGIILMILLYFGNSLSHFGF
jgi:membrane protein CcdC involved in cytochrome C biogenesis